MTAEEIAAKLSPAQKAFVLEMSGTSWPGYKPFLKCQELGLVIMRRGRFGDCLEWLPLGQQVRSILEGTSHADQ